jgi:ABC-type phosphate/phosphonate transport system substrate-binding protein
MTTRSAADQGRPKTSASNAGPSVRFLLDQNLGLPTDVKPWSDLLPAAGITAEHSTDLVQIDERMERHEPDIAYFPIADYHRMFARGDRHYRGLAIATSKFTGTTNLPSVLVVRADDPANGLDDLAGAECGYINKSCSSSYFPPAILLTQRGKKLDDFLKPVPVSPWQGQIDAVVSKQVRATMVPEDVWKTNPRNARETKIVGRYDAATPPLVVVRHDLDAGTCQTVLDALLAWVPKWDAVYGAFRPYYYADVQAFFHDLDQLPPGM